MSKLWGWLRGVAVAAGLLLAVGLLVGALFLGGYHMLRYVLAPRLGWVSPAQAFAENLRVATSPVRRLEERETALQHLLGMREYAATLTPAARVEAIALLANMALNELLPLDLRYDAARVQMLIAAANTADTSTAAVLEQTAPVQRAELAAADAKVQAAKRARLAELIALQGEAFGAASPERTRLIVELVRQTPCDRQLLQWIEELKHRDGVGTVERSFLFGIAKQSEASCS